MRVFLTYLFISCSLLCLGQNEHYSNDIKFKLGFGSLLPHRSYMKHLHTGNASVFEVTYNYNTYGKKGFHSVYNYPTLGLTAGVYNLGNPEHIGLSYTLTPSVSIPFGKGKYLPNIKLGIGMAYVSKPFDPINNYKNIAIGGHLNAAILFELEKSVKLSEKIKWYYSVSMMHFSNGASSLPNLGLNTFTYNTGISYAIGAKTTRLSSTDDIDKQLQFDIYGYGGWRENSIHVDKKYGVGEISFEASKRIGFKGQFMFGADAIYNSSIEQIDIQDQIEESEDIFTKKSNFQSGIFAGYGLVLGEISLIAHLGLYTINDYKDRGILYQRTSVRKQFGKKITASIGLKSHNVVAEYVEFGIGYRIEK